MFLSCTYFMKKQRDEKFSSINHQSRVHCITQDGERIDIYHTTFETMKIQVENPTTVYGTMLEQYGYQIIT